jgi:hypothetical protein
MDNVVPVRTLNSEELEPREGCRIVGSRDLPGQVDGRTIAPHPRVDCVVERFDLKTVVPLTTEEGIRDLRRDDAVGHGATVDHDGGQGPIRRRADPL